MGATCVTTAVTGHDEYVEHGRNALVVDWDDLRGTARQLDLLARDRAAAARAALQRAGDRAGLARHGSSRRSSWRWRCSGSPVPGADAGERVARRDAGRPARRHRGSTASSLQERNWSSRASAAKLDRVKALPGHRAGQPRWRQTRVRRRLASRVLALRRASGALMALLRRSPAPRLRVPGAARRCSSTCATGAGAADAATAPGASLRIAVVVPQFRRGSGGHKTIADLVRGLEARGHALSLWVEDEEGRHARRGRRRPLARVLRPRGRAGATRASTSGRAPTSSLATGWQTVHRALLLPGVAARAYLVQDHEPEFYGDQRAARVGRADLRARAAPDLRLAVARRACSASATASQASSFDLGVDHETYKPLPTHRRDDLVLFYARAVTRAPRGAARPARARGAQAPAAGGRGRAVRRGAQDPDAVQVPRPRRAWGPTSSPTPTPAPPSACASR